MSPVSAIGLTGYIIFWVLFAAAFGLFAQRMGFLFRLMRLGKAESRSGSTGRRIRTTLVEVVPQWCNLKSVTRKDLAGLGHAFMFWGFSFFLLGYIIFIGLAGGFGLAPVLEGTAFETVYLSILDIAGVAVTLALVWAAIRRYVVRPERLEPSAEAGIILMVVFLLMALSVFMEAFGFAAAGAVSGAWPPLGKPLAAALSGLSQVALDATYRGLWWAHYVVILGFMVYIPRSKHLHILLSPLNVYWKSPGPKMVLEPVPLEGETFGVSKIEEFTWKDMLDFYACAVCGRCSANCPAHVSGKALSPKDVIHNLKEHLLAAGPAVLAARATTNPAVVTEGQPEAPPGPAGKAMVGDVVTDQEVWDCTTCGACQEVCPVGIEHVRKVIGMRRNLVLMQSRMPETAQLMLRNMQTRGHPWAGVQSLRLRGDWTTGTGVRVLGEGDTVDTLLWVGCTGALVDRNVAATVSLAKVLKAAGISFGVLGEAEACCGDPARRAGYDFLFQTMAEGNIEAFKTRGVKEIITACPHCYNALKNEYPQYGGNFKVIHYTELIAGLVRQGRLKLKNGLASKITFHDPCYLGRYNNIYSAPRDVLRSIPQVRLAEMDRTKSKSFCCGGGGAHMWIEENTGRKINEIRIEDVIKTGADTVVAACPYCLQMMEEGIERKDVKATLKARDLSELVDKAIEA